MQIGVGFPRNSLTQHPALFVSLCAVSQVAAHAKRPQTSSGWQWLQKRQTSPGRKSGRSQLPRVVKSVCYTKKGARLQRDALWAAATQRLQDVLLDAGDDQ